MDAEAGFNSAVAPGISSSGEARRTCFSCAISFARSKVDRIVNRDQAETIAIHAHRAQTDLSGEPYILHVAEVAQAMRSYPDAEEIHFVSAWLHDVTEDTAIAVSEKLSVREIEVHIALTRQLNEAYADYIWRLCEDPVASIVKLADIWSNLRPERTALLPEHQQDSLAKRYAAAREQIWRANRTEWWPEPR